jgi:hypothetical protein
MTVTDWISTPWPLLYLGVPALAVFITGAWDMLKETRYRRRP